MLAALALSEMEAFDTPPRRRKISAPRSNTSPPDSATRHDLSKCYVHPEMVNGYLDGSLLATVKEAAERELRDDSPD